MSSWFQKQWAAHTFWRVLLLPISWLFLVLSSIRKFFYQNGWLNTHRLAVPVIVVGNINVGGTGKTPLVIWLSEQLKLAGYKPGIISRGYGGSAQQIQEVLAYSVPAEVGDEPVLIARRANCPVFVNADRVQAGNALLKAYPECDVIISDDGLQHYRLQRDVEIVVIDGAKGFGNGALLPAGPLREPITRLVSVDGIVTNGKWTPDRAQPSIIFEMNLESGHFYNLLDNTRHCEAHTFANKTIMAIAGIGNPERFFHQLQRLGVHFQSHAYPDHHAFQPQDFSNMKTDIILMTEKDAVKCQSFAQANFWVLPVSAVIKDDLMAVILNKLRR
ncbi:MAG: tetraacyldisaccharide 4'-kinase [Methylotenera sp.]|nr:tetraacyldisaccharide 4'-kinase [Methylotenera sp.]